MKKYIPKIFLISLPICIFTVVIFEIVKKNAHFAEWVNSTLSFALRRVMALFSHPFSVSLAEILALIALPAVILLIVIAFKIRSKAGRVKYLLSLLSLVMLIYSGYIFALAVPYHIEPLDKKMNLCETDVTEQELYEVL